MQALLAEERSRLQIRIRTSDAARKLANPPAASQRGGASVRCRRRRFLPPLSIELTSPDSPSRRNVPADQAGHRPSRRPVRVDPTEATRHRGRSERPRFHRSEPQVRRPRRPLFRGTHIPTGRSALTERGEGRADELATKLSPVLVPTGMSHMTQGAETRMERGPVPHRHPFLTWQIQPAVRRPPRGSAVSPRAAGRPAGGRGRRGSRRGSRAPSPPACLRRCRDRTARRSARAAPRRRRPRAAARGAAPGSAATRARRCRTPPSRAQRSARARRTCRRG